MPTLVVHIIWWGSALMVPWWAHSPPTIVGLVGFPESTTYTCTVCHWFSPKLCGVFLQTLGISILLKNQHFQIPFWSGYSGRRATSWMCHPGNASFHNWRARWKKGLSDDLGLKSKLLLFSWTLAHRLVFMWGTLLRTYFLTWDLKFEELAYYFCVKSFVELNSLKWCVKDFFCSLPELKQRNST